MPNSIGRVPEAQISERSPEGPEVDVVAAAGAFTTFSGRSIGFNRKETEFSGRFFLFLSSLLRIRRSARRGGGGG